MINIYKKIENELNSLSPEEREKILVKLRNGIDEIDQRLVKLLCKRTLHSVLIGRIKRSLNLPTYNPEREKQISKRIASYREDPLSEEALLRIYERILDESRAIQREELEKGNVFKVPDNKISLRNILSKKEFLIVFGFFVLILWLLYYTFFTSNHYNGSTPIMLEVKRGEPESEIVGDLYNKGIIPSRFNMKAALFIYGANKKIRAARYYIPNGMSYLDLVYFLLHSKANLLKTVTVLPGSSLGWIAAKLHYDLGVDSASVIDLCQDKEFIDSLGADASSLLGYLLPQKYDMYQNSSPEEDLSLMYRAFCNFMTDSLKDQARNSGLTVNEVVTLASIVDGETNSYEEMPKIAGVYLNRLKKGMPLQADPTVEFIKRNGWGRLSYSDLRINSPYNTYLHSGLPPGPINNPGKNAILAVLFPQKTNYLYFVSDGNGEHIFTNNYSEHLRNAEKYRKWLETLKKK